MRNFAQDADIKPSTLQNILSGTSPTLPNLVAIAKAAGVSIDWLATGQGEPQGRGLAGSGDLIHIPRYNVVVSAGTGAVVLDQEVSDAITVSRDILSRINVPSAQLGVVQAIGDSMEPVIFEGDYLIVSFAINRRHVDAGGIFVVSYDGGLYVKRLRTARGGVVEVLSANPAYAPESFTAEEAEELLQVHAKVVWKLGPLRS